jgi:phage shock protein A
MSEIAEIKRMLQNHIEASSREHSEVKQSLARIEVHNEYTKKQLDEHDKDIKTLNRWKWASVASFLTGGISWFK